MGDNFNSHHINDLRKEIRKCLRRHPDCRRWFQVKQRLIQDGNVAKKCIKEFGPEILSELIGLETSGSGQAEPSPPPSSPDALASPKPLVVLGGGGDGGDSADGGDTGGSTWADGEEAEVRVGPTMVDQDATYDIGGAIVHSDNSTGRLPMSANFCRGTVNFVNRVTLEARKMTHCINRRSNTVTLDWRANKQYEKDFGDVRFHRTQCVVVSSARMHGVDVALTEDNAYWEAPLLPGEDSVSDHGLPNSIISFEDEQKRKMAIAANLISQVTENLFLQETRRPFASVDDEGVKKSRANKRPRR